MAKKKKQGRKGKAAAELNREEATEELLALQAIYGDELEVHDSPRLGFTLRVLPHPAEASANFVSCRLCISYPDDYPHQELTLKLTDAAGLQEVAVRQLSKTLHTAAAEFAADGEVCCFQLITAAQEFLQQHNTPPDEEEEEGPAALQSLWHEMLQRDMAAAAAAAASREQSFRTPVMGDTFFDSLDGGGLFSDAADLLVAGGSMALPPATAAVPVVEVRSKQAARPPKPPQHKLGVAEASTTAALLAQPARAARAASVGAAQGSTAAAAASTKDEATGTPAGGTPADEAAAAAGPPSRQASMAAAGASVPPPSAADSRAGQKLGQDSGVSSGGGNSMLKTLGHSIRGVLPKALRRYIDGSAATPEGSEAGEASVLQLAEEDRQLIRQELFLGHLLTLAASSGAVPPHALPSIAGMLQAEGLIPKWLAFTLTQQPALFDRAFQRVFQQELEAAAQQEESDSEDPMRWAVQRFWKRRAAPLTASRSITHQRSRSGLPPGADQLPASRYEADFTELRALGRGGYGVVVSAINRLDGRMYAVKKIPLEATSAGAYERIMREVTTLSRLQHPNVVRYYQAWVELCALVDEGEDSELDEWGSGTVTPSSTGGGHWGASGGGLGSRPGSGGAGGVGLPGLGGSRGHLAPVAEVSREGRASTPSKGTRGLREASVGSGSSRRSSDDEGEEEEGEGDGDEEEEGRGSASRDVSFSLGFGANMAVAGANALLAAPGSASQFRSRGSGSLDGGGHLSAWGSSDWASQSQSASDSRSRSQTGTLSTSAGGAAVNSSGKCRGGKETSLTLSGSSDFTFDRSRPPGAGSSLTQPPGAQPSGRGGARQRAMQQMLFIQMEFCPRTLRDVLDSGELDEERRWSILRQILAGLAHIHSQGIIHRDLKPANTFLDSQGNVKLGDFGLAKYNRDSAEGDAEPSPSTHSGAGQPGWAPAGGGTAGASGLMSETTGLVGTSYYISPEIMGGWASYDAKVDLFSLGVMAFELWHPFDTAMERAVLLRDLRENGVMPATFEADHPVVCRLIRWLLAANPAERPTAVEVLRSELLPPQVLDEQLTDLLRCLPDNPAMHERVLDAVFSLAAQPGPVAAAALEAPGAPIPVQMAARDHVVSVLKECFERHGAVGMCSQELGLASGDDPPGAVHLLTPGGAKLALRWELRQAFVAWYVQQLAAGGGGATLLLDGLRRYEVAAVQRRSAGQGLPRSFLQADLDFVMAGERSAAELLLGDAEVITCTYGALAELPECGEVEVRLGHRALFELALAFVGVSREARGSVVQLLSTAAAASPLHATARAKRWPAIKAGLEGIGLSGEAIARCRQLVLQAAGEGEAALFRLRTMLQHTVAGRQAAGAHRTALRPHSGAAALACLDELQQLLQYLQAWGLPACCLLVDPLLAPHGDAFSGCLFQCHLVQGASGATAVVAAGGRYDSLLKASWARQSALSGTVAPMPPLHASGVTLNVDRLVHVAQGSSRWRTHASLAPVAGLPRLSQADVLVCSRGGGGLLKERMALVRSLWDAGVAAEMLPQAAPSLTEQYEYAQSRGIAWLVIIAANTFEAADTVRVKAMNVRLEEDVSVSDLPSYLLAALHPHGSGAPGTGARPQHVGAGRAGEDADANGEQEEPLAHGWRERQRRGGRR